MNINDMTLEQIKALAQKALDAHTSSNYKIVVLDRGFVYIGYVAEEADFVTITEAQCIRRWGTTKGLGQLVEGPTPDTILDYTGTVKAPMRAVLSFIDVKTERWVKL